MENYPIDLVCDECHELMEWDIYEGVTVDRLYVKPCKHCAAQQSVEPTVLCAGHPGGSDVKNWICQTCGLPMPHSG